MTMMTIDLTLSTAQLSQLDEVARTRQIIMSEAIQLAVTEWLDRQWRLHEARQKMRGLGQGLGQGQAPYDTARKHDTCLYTSNR